MGRIFGWPESVLKRKQFGGGINIGFRYVSSAGNDGDDGLTPATAWQTISKVNGETFLPETQILFNRGDTWREKLTVPSSGESGKPITFGAYGAGDKPIISGAVLVTGWTANEITETWGENSGDDNTGVTEDTYVQGGVNSGTNYDGSLLVLRDYDTAGDFSRKTFIRFDLSGGTENALSASLNLLPYSANSSDCLVTKCTRAWVEATATWDDYDGSNPWGANHDQGDTLITYEHSQPGGYISLSHADFLTYVQSVWGSGEINLSIYTDDAVLTQYAASEGTNGHRPYLEITYGYEDVFKATLVDGGSGPTMVWFDDTLGTNQASVAACVSDGDWYWAANVLYINSSTDPSGRTIEASTLFNCIDQNEKSFITIENIKAEKSRFQNIRIDGNATDIILDSVESDRSFNHGIAIGVTGGAAVTPSNVTITGCIVTLPNREKVTLISGINQFVGMSGGDNLIIRNCTISSDETVDNNNKEDGIIVEDGDNILVESCSISGVGHAIVMWGSGVTTGDVETFTLRYNVIDSYDDAFWFRGTTATDSLTYYNLVTGCGDQYFDFIGEGGLVYNNTCYGGRNNAIHLTTLAATKVIFKNNIITNIPNGSNIFYINDSVGINIGNSTFDNNFYYRSSPSVPFGTMVVAGTFSFSDWQTTYSQDANGLNENPDLVNPSTDMHLQSVSPCRNAGVDVGLTEDYDGVSVPQETNPAIGAYEYVS